MMNELTNLLPASRAKTIRREYLVRLTTVVILGLIFIVLIHSVLLLPAYIYLQREVSMKTAELNSLSGAAKTDQEKEAQSQLTALTDESTHLLQLASAPTASSVLRQVLAVPRPNVRLTGFTFTPPTKAGLGSMQVSGVAATRESLRSYDQALGALSFVKSADLPISDYAKESNIPFTITLTGAFVDTSL